MEFVNSAKRLAEKRNLNKAKRKSLRIASGIIKFIFLFGFWLNILPDNVTSAPGLAAAMSNFGVGLLIVNLGTLIDLEDMIKEWKTVVVALLGMVGVVIGAFTIGAMLFGREWALTAVPAGADRRQHRRSSGSGCFCHSGHVLP